MRGCRPRRPDVAQAEAERHDGLQWTKDRHVFAQCAAGALACTTQAAANYRDTRRPRSQAWRISGDVGIRLTAHLSLPDLHAAIDVS